ncbi:SNF2 family N-terminal domain [Enterobacter hormaechei]|nr:SNF2 family N-terminal domain [Enterobacter hormaechei]
MIKQFTPRPYQDLIINHEIDILRCNIWAGMGMGKTVATLTTLEDLFMAGAETQPALVLAPLRVAASTWPDEAVKWGHLRNIEVQPIVGNAKARAAALANSNASVFTINYDNLVWLVEELGSLWPFGTVIPDESTRLKSFRLRGGGKRAAALGKVAHKHIRRWMNLTGTPAPNGLVDLWGQAWFVDQGQRLGRTYGAFTSRWFKSIQFPGQSWTKLEPFAHSQSEIQRALADVTISLDAADWFDIKEPIHNVIRVDMPPKARQQYREMEKEMFLELNGEGIEAPNAAAKTVKCLQIASGAVYTDDAGSWSELHDAKLQALDSILTEAAGAGGLPLETRPRAFA